jgi:hypothetical protein
MDSVETAHARLKARREPAPAAWWYSIALGFLAVFVIQAGAFIYLYHLQKSAESQKAAADRQAAAQRQTSLRVTCTLIQTMEDFYSSIGTPGATNVSNAWERLRGTVGCDQLKGGK